MWDVIKALAPEFAKKRDFTIRFLLRGVAATLLMLTLATLIPDIYPAVRAIFKFSELRHSITFTQVEGISAAVVTVQNIGTASASNVTVRVGSKNGRVQSSSVESDEEYERSPIDDFGTITYRLKRLTAAARFDLTVVGSSAIEGSLRVAVASDSGLSADSRLPSVELRVLGFARTLATIVEEGASAALAESGSYLEAVLDVFARSGMNDGNTHKPSLSKKPFDWGETARHVLRDLSSPQSIAIAKFFLFLGGAACLVSFRTGVAVLYVLTMIFVFLSVRTPMSIDVLLLPLAAVTYGLTVLHFLRVGAIKARKRSERIFSLAIAISLVSLLALGLYYLPPIPEWLMTDRVSSPICVWALVLVVVHTPIVLYESLTNSHMANWGDVTGEKEPLITQEELLAGMNWLVGHLTRLLAMFSTYFRTKQSSVVFIDPDRSSSDK